RAAARWRELCTSGRDREPFGARTALFVPELDRLYVAEPAGWNEPAAIVVYRPVPNIGRRTGVAAIALGLVCSDWDGALHRLRGDTAAGTATCGLVVLRHRHQLHVYGLRHRDGVCPAGRRAAQPMVRLALRNTAAGHDFRKLHDRCRPGAQHLTP